MSNSKPLIMGFVLCALAGAIYWLARQPSVTGETTAPGPAAQATAVTSSADVGAPGVRPGGPWFTAQVRFNILDDRSLSPLVPANPNSAEELTSYMRTQTNLIKIKEFGDIVFDLAKIQSTNWYKSFESREHAAKELDAALDARIIPNTSLIAVTLSISQRDEVDLILNAIAEQYVAWHDSLTAQQRESDLKAFRDQLNTAEKSLTRAQADADDFRSLHDIISFPKFIEDQSQLLLDLERELHKLLVDREQFETVVDQVTELQKDEKYTLPAEAVEQIERDPVFRSLDDLRMSLERSREVAIKTADNGAESPEAKKIAVELEVTNKQLKERKETLSNRAKERQLYVAASGLATVNVRILKTKKLFDEKQAEIRRLDNDMVAYRSREYAVEIARAEFSRAQADFNKQDAIFRSLRSRVQFVSRAKPAIP